MSYHKPWKSYDDQLNQLIERGMLVTDRERALDYLERIGYYRLSGYWFACRERSGPLCLLDEHDRKTKRGRVERIALDSFRAGTTFQNAVDLYVFDKQLRLLVLDALERIEVALRVDVSHTLGKLDRFAYLKPELLHNEFSAKLDKDSGLTKHHNWLSKHAQLIGRSKEEFVRHNRAKYGLPLAIWVACEVWDFGTLSTLFDGMREAEQDMIASQYGVSNGRTFATWLRSLNYLRNICAHHSRLWNRNIVDQPKLPSATELQWVAPFEADAHARARCFLLLKIASHLLRVFNPKSSWSERMKAHLLAFPNLTHLELNLAGMGAPTGWEAEW
ncbi:Abi family protein [Ectothiorhodospira lacustris]|uniref:Abi family protein n=1 Tax=Ectothiorhodospira lacustris TaxID=2899127 RepID=UPI001EE85296|nr:Abi family protein [Ectothiorhodospira lacustris]MCG5509015.1 Abi family protein [Ectothiorhodospira lacustris]MCG5520806.1 Abi family protein [Ectothiorhodospira lacustris]